MTKLLDKIGSKVWSKIQFATTVQIGFLYGIPYFSLYWTVVDLKLQGAQK
jgi:hypothetical protein